MERCNYIACAGGGTHGTMFIGMLRGLETHMPRAKGTTLTTYLQHMKGFAGTSIGALTSLAMLLKLTSNQICQICAPHLACMRSIVPRPDLGMLLAEYGLDDGQALRDMIYRVLRAGGICENVTFEDIERLLQREFVCVATNVHTREPIYFSAKNTPTIRVADGLFMSMCIPFVFVPIRYKDDVHVDGALSQNMPDAFPPEETLFIDFDMPQQTNRVDSMNDYLMAIFSMTIDESCWYRRHTCLSLRLPTCMTNEYSMDFDVTAHTSWLRINCGFASVLMELYPAFLPTMVLAIELAYEVALEQQRLVWAFDDELETYSAS